MSSNPIVETVLGSLESDGPREGRHPAALDRMVRERAGQRRAAKLTNPINIGIGTK